MTDYFALFDESRRPWLDLEELKAKFLARTAAVHPDRAHHATATEKQAANRRYGELNAAYCCLREPKTRLQHLLELERGHKVEDVQKIPAGAMDLFLEVSRHCRETDAFLAGKANATSPLLKVQSFEQGIALTDNLHGLLEKLNGMYDALIEQMRNLNLAWESAPPVGSPRRIHVLPCGRLEHIYRDLSYLTRWTQQLRERSVQLSFHITAPK